MKHSELIDIGAKWLNKIAPNCTYRCPFVVNDLVTFTPETPDIFGFTSGGTVLIEVKVSRSDFLVDKKKPFRRVEKKGMGISRLYLCPEGIIKISDLPEKWGLLWVDDAGVITIQKDSVGCDVDWSAERSLMYSIIRRLGKPGILNKQFNK